ncbi:hypothetical protein [Roseomonas sp. 18066]|uniref:hypothetical protein n=1 Tax=Roseomonas sp. 18066 TaxID=2681412 RepID=UPI001358A717|nr:hypothetical protein [Roseomonas sp. 18066]
MDEAHARLHLETLRRHMDGAATATEAKAALDALQTISQNNLREHVRAYRDTMGSHILPPGGDRAYWLHRALQGIDGALGNWVYPT